VGWAWGKQPHPTRRHFDVKPNGSFGNGNGLTAWKQHDRGKRMPYVWVSDNGGEPNWRGMSGGQNSRTAVMTKMMKTQSVLLW